MGSKGMKRCGWRSDGRRPCTKLVKDSKHNYCEEHQKEYMAGFRNRASSSRAPSSLYSRAAWKRLREAQLAREPLCAICGKLGYIVDHIQPHRGDVNLFFDSENLSTLCKVHHDQVTQMEIGMTKAGFSDEAIRERKIKDWIGTPLWNSANRDFVSAPLHAEGDHSEERIFD